VQVFRVSLDLDSRMPYRKPEAICEHMLIDLLF
jgi:hypothetical protein